MLARSDAFPALISCGHRWGWRQQWKQRQHWEKPEIPAWIWCSSSILGSSSLKVCLIDAARDTSLAAELQLQNPGKEGDGAACLAWMPGFCSEALGPVGSGSGPGPPTRVGGMAGDWFTAADVE